MNSTYLVTVCESPYFDLEIQATDKEAIYSFQDPDKQQWLHGASAHKLNNPDLYRSWHKRELDIIEVIEGVEP